MPAQKERPQVPARERQRCGKRSAALSFFMQIRSSYPCVSPASRPVSQQAVAGDLVPAAAGGKFQHVRIGLGDTAGDDHTSRIAHIEHIALGKLAINLANTHRKQGRATADQRLRSTVINRHRAVGLVAQRDPQLRGAMSSAPPADRTGFPRSPRARRTRASGSSPEQITL